MRYFITLILILAASGLICSQSDLESLSTICRSETCCEQLQNPNPITGVGYLEFLQSCATNFGQHCLGITGCQRCFNPSGRGPNLGNRPVCRRFTTPPSTTGPTPPSTTGQTTSATTTGGGGGACTSQACCDRRSNPNFQTGVGFWEFDPICLEGGVGCVNRTGCRRCFNPHGTGPNTFNEQFCRRFLPCNSTRCCQNIEFPNNRTGEGYYQYAPRCIPNGGLHCVENTGCEICFSVLGAGPNHGNRPPCTRFLPCRTDDCCALLQVPISTGEGFLQFSSHCTSSTAGQFCVFERSGCQRCFNPLGSGPNAQGVPVCNRFRG